MKKFKFLIVGVASFASFICSELRAATNFESIQSNSFNANQDDVFAGDMSLSMDSSTNDLSNNKSKSLSNLLKAITKNNDILNSMELNQGSTADVFGFDDAPFAESDPF